MHHSTVRDTDLDARDTSPAHLAAIAKGLYRSTKGKWRLLQGLRPYICPFDELIRLVPANSRVLDVGCGAGLFLLLLSKFGRLARGEAFDVSPGAIFAAQTATASAGLEISPRFYVRSIEEGIPSGDWTLITVVDVLHHVPAKQHQDFLLQVAAALPPGSRLLIKDMVRRPRWRAAANQLHDLVMARQWVHHTEPSAVEGCLSTAGLVCIHRSSANMFWYGHWTLMMERPPKCDTAYPAGPGSERLQPVRERGATKAWNDSGI
jgi:2-polyprenyl-3-methyl-5-hydroxy-6-metoxy-1,4-benzoquinol methylase